MHWDLALRSGPTAPSSMCVLHSPIYRIPTKPSLWQERSRVYRVDSICMSCHIIVNIKHRDSKVSSRHASLSTKLNALLNNVIHGIPVHASVALAGTREPQIIATITRGEGGSTTGQWNFPVVIQGRSSSTDTSSHRYEPLEAVYKSLKLASRPNPSSFFVFFFLVFTIFLVSCLTRRSGVFFFFFFLVQVELPLWLCLYSFLAFFTCYTS